MKTLFFFVPRLVVPEGYGRDVCTGDDRSKEGGTQVTHNSNTLSSHEHARMVRQGGRRRAPLCMARQVSSRDVGSGRSRRREGLTFFAERYRESKGGHERAAPSHAIEWVAAGPPALFFQT